MKPLLLSLAATVVLAGCTATHEPELVFCTHENVPTGRYYYLINVNGSERQCNGDSYYSNSGYAFESDAPPQYSNGCAIFGDKTICGTFSVEKCERYTRIEHCPSGSRTASGITIP